MYHSLRMLSCGGDTLLADWDTETVSKTRLQEIETEFNRLIKERGMIPADITDKRNELVPGEKFNPDADTLMIPHMVGG